MTMEHAGGSAAPLIDEAVVGELEGLEGIELSDLVELYLSEAVLQIAELGDAIGRGDALGAAKAAHKLKGGSSTVGATLVAQLAAGLEATAKAGDLAGSDGLLDGLRRALDRTRAAYGARAASPG